jgi:hypothetical protein
MIPEYKLQMSKKKTAQENIWTNKSEAKGAI